MEQPNLKELEAIIAIARRGTSRAAAIDLGMSTTALSHTVGRLEAGLGVRLFNRTTRSVSLTDAGRLFMQQVAPSLQDLRTALETVRSQRETPSGTIRINAAPFAARAIISPLVLEFLRRYPDMHVDIVTEGIGGCRRRRIRSRRQGCGPCTHRHDCRFARPATATCGGRLSRVVREVWEATGPPTFSITNASAFVFPMDHCFGGASKRTGNRCKLMCAAR